MNRRAPAERAKKSIDSARAEVEALRSALAASEARAAQAEAKVTDAQAQIAALTLMIEKLRRALYGRRSERSERLLGQLELELDELTARAAEDELATETASERSRKAHPRVAGVTRSPLSALQSMLDQGHISSVVRFVAVIRKRIERRADAHGGLNGCGHGRQSRR